MLGAVSQVVGQDQGGTHAERKRPEHAEDGDAFIRFTLMGAELTQSRLPLPR